MCKALIVDDNPSVLDVLAAIVEFTGKYDKVDKTMSGEDALEIFEAGKYELVLLDIGLVKMSGVEVSLELRKLDTEVTILAITGHRALIEDVNLKVAGFNDCFLKPFGYKKMLEYIDKLAQKRLTK